MNFKDQVSQIRAQNPDILFIIERSKNQNIVVYEANRMVGDRKRLDSKNPLQVYWLDIDPEYVKAARRKGKMHDREELGSIEKRMAYGFSSEGISGNPSVYRIKLVAFPQREITLYLDSQGRAYALMEISGVQSQLKSVYIHSEERRFALPKVKYIDLEGLDAKGNMIKERIVPQ